MANTKTEVKTTATKNTKNAPKAKESKVMKQEVKVEETKEVKAVANSNKLNLVSIEEITAMYSEAGIVCKNPNAKGAYRIMKGGSSLNIKPVKGYYIYSSNDDLALIQESGLKNEDLVVEQGTNAQDKTRPNTIICKTTETLKALLKVYAMNPLNKAEVKAE